MRTSSQEEGSDGGGNWSALSGKRSTITITVVSDAQGQYAFPRNRIEPGQYSIRIRAVGYEMDTPGAVDIADQENDGTLDLKLHSARDLLTSTLKWRVADEHAVTQEQKQIFLNCDTCHTFERIVRSQHDAAEFAQVMRRMTTYAQGSTPSRPQLRPRGPAATGGDGGSFSSRCGTIRKECRICSYCESQ